MRRLLRGVVALVILIAAYWVWALAGAAQLASAAGLRHRGRRVRARSQHKTANREMAARPATFVRFACEIATKFNCISRCETFRPRPNTRKVTPRASLGRVRPMRILIRGVVALVILLAAYWGWALAGVAQLASAAERGDADAVIERVDLQALIRSLSGQIARAFLDQNPQLQKLPPPRQGVFLNASAAEMLLRALLTPDNIAALLSQGRVGVVGAGGKDAGTVWGMPSLGEAFHARPLQVIMHSYFDGPRSFVVGLDSSDGRYRIHMNLSGLTWRMSGVDVPEPITARLTRLIAQRIGGAVDLPKD
jgi:hypothetical protein